MDSRPRSKLVSLPPLPTLDSAYLATMLAMSRFGPPRLSVNQAMADVSSWSRAA